MCLPKQAQLIEAVGIQKLVYLLESRKNFSYIREGNLEGETLRKFVKSCLGEKFSLV